MNSKFACILTFTLGAAVGAVASWSVLKSFYERKTDEEVDSVKEYYASKYGEKAKYEGPEDSDEAAYQAAVKKYRGDSTTRDGEGKEEDAMRSKPYVISPQEFAEIEEYETTTLYYFSDGILTHLSGEVVEDVDETVGTDSLNHFGEYEEDSVYVRNDELKCDFEILRDSTRYSDGPEISSRQAED